MPYPAISDVIAPFESRVVDLEVRSPKGRRPVELKPARCRQQTTKPGRI